jgi:SagB-type dehydrogenase family enzyme
MLENYTTGARVSAEPLACQLLHFFDRWRSVESLISEFAEFTPGSLRAAVDTLERHSFLRRSGGTPDRRSRAMKEWASWNPAAGFFHFSTKDVRFTSDHDAHDRFLRRKAKVDPMPPPVKRYRGARQFRLPTVVQGGEFPQILLARRTWRDFSRRPLKLADLSTLLGLTWRVQGWLDLPGIGQSPLKTSPSGGARHPIEVYVLARRVEELPVGLYHYAADRHRLELLRRGVGQRQIARYLPTQWWFGSAAALMIMTAVFPRTQWKYQFARAYRVVLAEAGHLCQTFCLTATWLQLAPFCTMALADSRIEKDLQLDGISESVLYVAGVGVRPTDASLVPRSVRAASNRGGEPLLRL